VVVNLIENKIMRESTPKVKAAAKKWDLEDFKSRYENDSSPESQTSGKFKDYLVSLPH
jgi:hypothetical protein